MLLLLSALISALSSLPTPVPGHWSIGGVAETAEGVGVAGFQVRVSDGGTSVATALTGADGKFLLEFEGPDRTTASYFFEMMPRPGWRTKTPSRNISDLREVRPAQLVFVVAEATTSQVRGRIVDSEGEPVVAYRMLIGQSDGPGELLVSDAEGKFETENEFAHDEIRFKRWENSSGPVLNPLNHAPPANEHAQVFDGSPITLTVKTGPSYRISGTTPEGLPMSKRRAMLRGTDPNSISFRDRKGPTALIRTEEDGTEWARFVPISDRQRDILGPKPWTFFVGTRDHKYGCHMEIPDEVGTHPFGPELEMVFPDHGAISVTVSDAYLSKGVRVPKPVRKHVALARIRRLGATEWNSALQRKMTLHPDRDGTAIASWTKLPVGTYEIQISGNYYKRKNLKIEIGEGGDIREEHHLKRTPRREWMRVEAHIRCASGASPLEYVRWARLSGIGNVDYVFESRNLRSVGSPSDKRYDGPQAYVHQVKSDELVLLFPDLPLEEYRLNVAAARLPVDPPELYVAPGDQRVEIVLRDDGADAGLGFDLRTGTTAHPEFRLWTKVNRSPYTGQFFDSGMPVFLKLRQEESWQWSVAVPGHARAYGDRTAFDGDGSTRLVLAKVELRPGWGIRLRAVGPNGGLLDGVEVRAGDQLLGTTQNGLADLFSESRPDSLQLTYRDWHVAGGHVDRVTGAFTEDGFLVHVRLAP